MRRSRIHLLKLLPPDQFTSGFGTFAKGRKSFMLKVYIETYGCQMNVADSEVVAAILMKQDYELSENPENAHLILVNTCSIRENAEQRVKTRLLELGRLKKQDGHKILGVIGCMAGRLREEIVENMPLVDLVAGPDSYRELPNLIARVTNGSRAINTELSLEETYSEIRPVRTDANKVSAFVSVMRGCNNFCSYCVVPYTRGRERSRNPQTISSEAESLYSGGYREITLLGQNVNSYHWKDAGAGDIKTFPDLIRGLAGKFQDLRIRFATSHPKDLSMELLEAMADHQNICRHIHLPVQSGSDSILERMNRKYSVSDYRMKIDKIRSFIPEASISTDIITGFCGETEEDHKNTLDLMQEVGYDFAYMFKYSERAGTPAAKKFYDDVPEEIKTRRLSEIIYLQNSLSLESKKKDVGKVFEVLIEGEAKKSNEQYYGRTSQNKVAVFPKINVAKGDYTNVIIEKCTSATLIGKIV
ncbi:MAG: tRNA (N6-isopentenyl adenosine(37)-C2)-methylthiotransferase MiaB [Bacteroidales bacterium]|nr:tRNA (N6-isopentenyl adenosine(37)-C2)-methylthiotransferase MiaB [Bacteroidales bacterium]